MWFFFFFFAFFICIWQHPKFGVLSFLNLGIGKPWGLHDAVDLCRTCSTLRFLLHFFFLKCPFRFWGSVRKQASGSVKMTGTTGFHATAFNCGCPQRSPLNFNLFSFKSCNLFCIVEMENVLGNFVLIVQDFGWELRGFHQTRTLQLLRRSTMWSDRCRTVCLKAGLLQLTWFQGFLFNVGVSPRVPLNITEDLGEPRRTTFSPKRDAEFFLQVTGDWLMAWSIETLLKLVCARNTSNQYLVTKPMAVKTDWCVPCLYRNPLYWWWKN